MSKRVSRVMSVNISAGVFPTFEAAVKEADAIKIWLVRLCQKHGYSVKATIGVSMNNPSTGSITTKKKGGRGRPTTVFERNTGVMRPTETEAHIHMVLYANPASTIIDRLAERINKKFHKRVAWVKDCEEYVSAAVNYLFKQSLKIRTVNYDRNDILYNDDFGYGRAVDAAMDEYRNILAFTKSEAATTPETIDSTTVSEVSAEQKELLCNRDINTTTDIIYPLLNTTTLIKDVPACIQEEREDKKDKEDTTSNDNSSIKVKEDKRSLIKRCIDTIHTLCSYIQEKFDKQENIHISSIRCMNIVPDEENPDFSP